MLRGIIYLVIVLALALAGCASDTDRQQGGEATSGVIPTDPVGSVEENTPQPGAPLLGGQTPGAEATQQAVEAPFLAEFIIDAEVAGQAGSYGAVKGIVIDAASGQGQYLVVQNIGPEVQKDVLLPWGAFQLVQLAPDQVQAAQGTFEPVIWLTVEDGIAAAAPEVDGDALEDPEQRAADWDAEARSYWNGKLAEMPVTGGNESDPRNILYLSQGAMDNLEYEVRSTGGEAVGKLENMVIRPDGAIAFGVVEFASLLDLGEQQVVVPWRLLAWSPEELAFTINATDEQLRSAPRFDLSALPDMTIPGWDQDWQRYWEGSAQQQTPAQAGAAAGSQLQLSRLMGSPVIDVNDAALGEVADIILGQNGVIDYLVIQAGDQLSPVPWELFELSELQDSLLYLDDVQRLVDAPAFAGLDQINAAAPGWDEQIRGYWGLGAR